MSILNKIGSSVSGASGVIGGQAIGGASSASLSALQQQGVASSNSGGNDFLGEMSSIMNSQANDMLQQAQMNAQLTRASSIAHAITAAAEAEAKEANAGADAAKGVA